jgi:chromate transporter
LLVGLGTLDGGGTLASLALFFLKTGAIVFGSGLAIVPFMRAGVVDQHHWLSDSQFLDSVAIGLITPGPVVISAGFIGHLVAGLPGAIVASVAIFTPIYLGIVVPGRWFLRHRDNAQLRAFVAGATAAAAGALSGAVVVLTRQAVTDWITAAIALATLGVLWRFKIKEPYVVVATGALGLLLF